jgi:hypothetical protein
MSASTPISRSCSATMKRNSALVITIGRANRAGSATRASVCWKVERSPISGMNCFGMLSRETGHSRVPAPPHISTGITNCEFAAMRGFAAFMLASDAPSSIYALIFNLLLARRPCADASGL